MTKTAEKTTAKTPKNGVKQAKEKAVEKPIVEETKQEAKLEEQNQATKSELESKAKKLKRAVERAKESQALEHQKCEEWLKEGNSLIAENERKFEADKVKKIIQLKEENSIPAIDILLGFYQSEIDRLSGLKKEKEDAGETGEFSSDYKQFLKPRADRFEKRAMRLKREWIQWTDDRKAKKLPVFEQKIANLESELSEIEKQIETTTEKGAKNG